MKARAWAKKPPPSHVEAWVEEWRRVRGRREASSDDPSPLFRHVPVPVPALPCVSRVCRESALARRCRGVRISRRVWVSRRVGVESVGVESVWVSRACGCRGRGVSKAGVGVERVRVSEDMSEGHESKVERPEAVGEGKTRDRSHVPKMYSARERPSHSHWSAMERGKRLWKG
jgi:hypothetical protein